MEEERIDQQPEEQAKYEPRPVWQVWLARIGLVAFIILLIIYYLTFFKGGA